MAGKRLLSGVLACVALSATPILAQGQQFRPWHQIAGLEADSARVGHTGTDRNRIAAELSVGNGERAREMLVQSSALSEHGFARDIDLWAAVSLEAGLVREAASWFAVEGEFATGMSRAVAFARAGRAYDTLGWASSAEAYFRLAGEAYPAVSGWLDLQVARVSEDSLAALWLRKVPAGANGLTQIAGAQIQLRLGNWSGAADIYRRAGRLDSAISVAARAGDSTLARLWAVEALETRSTPNLRAAVEFLASHSDPVTPAEMTRLAAAAIELGDNPAAIEFATEALSAGDTTATALRLLGRAQERAGLRTAALESYSLSYARGGQDGVMSRYSYGRLLLAMRRYSQGVTELSQFASSFPEHPFAAAALEAVAGRLLSAGDVLAADSVVDVLHRSFPRTREASTSRIRLAGAADAAGQTGMAERWYRAEVAAGGRERHFARYRLADSRRKEGDPVAADSLLHELADADPLGYYGSRARVETGRPLPVFEEFVHGPPSERVAEILEELDFLNAAGFASEAQAHLDFWARHDSLTTDETLDLAAALATRGEVARTISLGWRASRTAGLNDIRVVRAIFPWPFRDLIEVEAGEWNVDPYLVAAIIRQESAFDPDATSRAGARGLMQLMPATASWRANQGGYPWSDRYLQVPDANLHIGIGHLADLLSRSDHIVFALAAYNAGGGNLARWRRREDMNDPATFIEKIPFPETRGYVKAILRNRDIYRALYGGSGEPPGTD